MNEEDIEFLPNFNYGDWYLIDDKWRRISFIMNKGFYEKYVDGIKQEQTFKTAEEI
jgi:hypothetical protein